MPQLETITVIGVVVLAVLIWVYFRSAQQRSRRRGAGEARGIGPRLQPRVPARRDGTDPGGAGADRGLDQVRESRSAGVDRSFGDRGGGVRRRDGDRTTRSPARCCACARTITSSNSRSIWRRSRQLYHIWQLSPGGAWGEWASVGGPASEFSIGSTISIGHNANGALEVFTLASNGQLYHIWQLSPGGAWGGLTIIG